MTAAVHVLIVEARFYEALADQLAAGAIAVLEAAGASFERIAVPGSFELPAAIRLLMAASHGAPRYDGCIALGCVIEGATDHYEHICREASRGLMDVAMVDRVALGFGLLTCATYEQAEERADPARMNKGADAARACLRMIDLKCAALRSRQ